MGLELGGSEVQTREPSGAWIVQITGRH